MIDRLHIGAVFRAIRIEQRLRQADVARRAGVSQQTISRLERGCFGGLTVETYVRIADVLNAEIPLVPRLRGPRILRLEDRRHAAMQTAFAELLTGCGWTVTTEWSFNHFGDRGSVDILATLPSRLAMAIIEIKTDLTNLQDTLRILDMKTRVAPVTHAAAAGWVPANVATILVPADTTRNRKIVTDHAAMVDASLPARAVELRRWLDAPGGCVRGVWFFRNTPVADATQKPRGNERVRLSTSEAQRANRGRH